MTQRQLLLVEDDPQIVRAIVPALQVSGHAVTVAADGAAALRQLDSRAWDVVVVDLGLPDMDGTAVVQHLRHTSKSPVLMISARHSPPDQARCRDAGATGFLGKPFATPELIAWLKSTLAEAS